MSNPRAAIIALAAGLAAAVAPVGTTVTGAEASAGASPFADAVAAWHLRDLRDSAGKDSALEARGEARVGVALEGPDRGASVRRGGDGFAAEISGGFLDAGQGAGGELSFRGRALTLAVRLRDPSGTWNAPLVSKHGGHDRLVYNLFSTDLGSGVAIGFELGTEGTRGMTQVFVPLSLVGAERWHDVVCRHDGAKLQMFVDGVLVDEGFPMGALRGGNAEPCLLGGESYDGKPRSGFRGLIDHVALWNRALGDAEVEVLSGGREEVAARRLEILGEPGPLQYFRPHNQFNVGDTLPFFHEGVFHFYYLLDRGHHSAKGGYGAHQWAHASSRDLVRWEHHPLAVPITEEWEGSICTGSVFWNAGTWYAFYASRIVGKGEHLSLATGSDGIRFEKTLPNPFLSPGPRYGNGFRDPNVFRDPTTGLFHLIVSTMIPAEGRGCLAHWVSEDLKAWREVDPLLVEGTEVPECPDWFEWNGRYYLAFSNGGIARYRIASAPLGPWSRPRVETFDGGAARVAKTAAFAGNRRIATAFLGATGYADRAIFRELLQLPDGELGTRFPPELVPAAGAPAPLSLEPGPGATGDLRGVRLRAADAAATAALDGLPRRARISLRVVPGATATALGLRFPVGGGRTREVRIDLAARRVAVAGGAAIGEVDGLDRSFGLEVVATDGLLDICVDGRRTLIHPVPELEGGKLGLFVERGEAAFEALEVRPLLPRGVRTADGTGRTRSGS